MSVRVLIVDDSALVRRVLSDALASDADIQVIGAAKDPLEASEIIEKLQPDVLTLDLEMPEMDGMTFLRRLMRHHPMPVVIVSAYTKKGSRLAMEALENGALDIVQKPGMSLSLSEMTAELTAKVKAASQARLNGAPGSAGGKGGDGRQASAPAPARAREAGSGAAEKFDPKSEIPVVLPRIEKTVDPKRVVVIGSSTGGTQALQYILARLPDNMPPILIVQHMPPGFTRTFADRLNQLSPLQVKEAEHNDTVAQGQVLLAQGGQHMVLRKLGAKYRVELNEGPKVCRQRPSVEVLFHSVAKLAGPNAIGAILTGMGADGAEGLLAMKMAGAATMAEDEKSCVVFGMPKEAIKRGGVDQVVHLKHIPEKLVRLV